MKIIALMLTLLTAGCTDKVMSRTYGGESEVKIDPCWHVINVTWKEADLWILTEPADPVTFTPRSLVFFEDSSFGIMEGRVIVREQACK
jgi:hypothetical protein